MQEAHIATTDLCDAHEVRLLDGRLRVLPPQFLAWGQKSTFSGLVETVLALEDNTCVRQALEQAGNGRVLVVDGGGSVRCALLGGNLAVLAQTNGWSGVVVWGAVRDVAEIDRCAIGVRALAAVPRKSRKLGTGAQTLPVNVAGISVRPGEWCYVDRDGILISDEPI